MTARSRNHTFSYVTISGRIFDASCLVHSVDKGFLKMISEQYGVITSGKVEPYSFVVNGSPINLFSMMGLEGYILSSQSSGRSELFKTWIFVKEGRACKCSCHGHPVAPEPEEGASPPKIRRIDTETEKQDEHDEPVPVDNYEEIMEYFKNPKVNNPLTSAELFSLLSTAGFQVPFRTE